MLGYGVLKTAPLALSPDGQRYVYQGTSEIVEGASVNDIMVAPVEVAENPTATKMRSLVFTDTIALNAGIWSDDARLFFVNDKNRSKKKRKTWISVCDRDGSHINRISTGEAYDSQVVAVSPNGRFAITNATTMLDWPKDAPANKYVGNSVTLWDLASPEMTPHDKQTSGDILVELHCGDDFIFSFLDEDWIKKKKLDRLILKLRENSGINYIFRSTGPGDALSAIVVRDPTRRTDRDPKLRSLIEKAIRSAGLSENTRWSNERTLAASEDRIAININCGAEFLLPYSGVKWRAHEAKAEIKINQLYFQLNMIKGLDAQYRITGAGNNVSIVVKDPSERAKRDAKLKAKIESILKSTGVWKKTSWPNVKSDPASSNG